MLTVSTLHSHKDQLVLDMSPDIRAVPCIQRCTFCKAFGKMFDSSTAIVLPNPVPVCAEYAVFDQKTPLMRHLQCVKIRDPHRGAARYQ